MWIVLRNVPRPDIPVWPGRRWLAFADAVSWPAVWIAVALRLPRPGGVVVPVIMALAGLFAVRRCWQAIVMNERYRFTTWRWGYPVAMLMVLGIFIKLALLLRP